jgi:uncharacterized radical SAM superfamily Fe-S cluster-containing enzyme
VTQVLYLVLEEMAFEIDFQSTLTQAGEDSVQTLYVFFQGLTEDTDIIQVQQTR